MERLAPAFRIPLAASELQTLGELCAIQGQVEHLLVHTLHYILDLPLETARTMLASSSIHTNAKIWIAVFREKCHDLPILGKAEAAFDLVERTTKGRNDFVHAIFATPKGSMWMLDVAPKGAKHRRSTGGEAVAVRTRDIEKKRPISDLISVRNDAARLSVLLSEIASEFLPE
ncbi:MULTISPECIES: hypothetical protein [unclassified Bradyrhizobium]|uniref:hypothetical protein n=1 Tax=unclassified Bradyrhizobium TaxID=2631580 RepID=UPI0028E2CBB2|nr:MULTISPECIES: hypothetical protein [unclassified Bradyrhizobium]